MYSSLMALDAFEEIVRRSYTGKRLEEKIKNNEFGDSVYITQATLLIFLQKINYELNLLSNAMRLLYQLPQDNYEKQPKPPYLSEEFVSPRAWGLAITWIWEYSLFPYSSGTKKNQISLDLLGWTDVGMMRWINEDMPNRPKQVPLEIVITQNRNYAEVAKLAQEDESIPKFQVRV